MCSENCFSKCDGDNNNGHHLRKADDVKKKTFGRQMFVCFGVFMLTLGAGATAGYSAVLIPQLQHEKEDNYFSTELISWVAAISSLPLFFGSFISGYLMDKLGRRVNLIALSIPFIIGWIIIGISSNIYVILFGRFITGFCQGWLGPAGPVFVGEISSPQYRGFLLASLSLAIAGGVFLSHLFGTFLHWKYAALLCGTFPLIGFSIIINSPESPMWLICKGRLEECIDTFFWYRGRNTETNIELENLIQDQTNNANSVSKIQALRENLRRPEFWKPLAIMATFFIVSQLTGVNVMCAYTTTLMKALINGNTSEYAVMLVVDVLRCISLTAACLLFMTRGRRPMALISGSVTALSLILLALYLYLIRIGNIVDMSPVITLGLMSIYIIFSHMGIVPLPWNMVGELFPNATKGLGSGISVMMSSVALFGTVKSAPALFVNIGFDGTYLFYGISTLLGTIFLMLYLPETKNRTLLQVEEYFRSKQVHAKECELKNLRSV